MQEIRPQMGYRVEQFGITHSGLRFAHPVYEEAFAAMATRDSTVAQLAVCLVETVADIHVQTCLNGILRNAGKYPQLTQFLLRPLVEYVKQSGTPELISPVGLKMVAAYDLTKDNGFLDLIRLLASTDELISLINAERGPDTMRACLRFLVNSEMRVSGRNLTELDPCVAWTDVYQTVCDGSLYSITEFLEWATYIRPTAAQEFFSSWSRTTAQRRIAMIQRKHRRSLLARLQPLLLDSPVFRVLENLSEKTPHVGWREYFSMLARTPQIVER